jgi:hypothetical protein
MIIVVEGPNASGKTTWSLAHAGATLLLETRYPGPPSEASDALQAQYWARVNRDRWVQATAIEARHGFAGLTRLGLESIDRFLAGVGAVRRWMAHRLLGIADLVLCSVPDDATLERQRGSDTNRTRSNFAVHRQLARPLFDWYSELDELDPGRMVWSFPESVPHARARSRHDLGLFDAWMAKLPWDAN